MKSGAAIAFLLLTAIAWSAPLDDKLLPSESDDAWIEIQPKATPQEAKALLDTLNADQKAKIADAPEFSPTLLSSAGAEFQQCQSGNLLCAPHCNNQCSESSEDCPFLHQLPGTELLGFPVDIQQYTSNLVDLTSTHVLAESVVTTSENMFNCTPNFNGGIYQRIVGGKTINYVLPYSAATPVHYGVSGQTVSLSNSRTSHASSWAAHAGFGVSVGIVSISASMSASGSKSDADSEFAGTAQAHDTDYKVSLSSDATFSPEILDGVGQYDGTPAAKLAYTNLFKHKIGLYFVTSVTVGGFFEYSTTVKTTASTDAKQYAFDLKAKISFVSASGGGAHTDKTDAYHQNEQSNCDSVGGDDSLRAKLMGYQPSIKGETIDTSKWQTDYTAWLGSIAEQPVALDMTVSVCGLAHLF